MSRSSVLALAFAALFALQIVLSARRHRLHERHTLGWLLVCAGIAALAIWREGIDALAGAMGIYYSPSALFFACISALLWIVYRQSQQISELRLHVRQIAQQMALMDRDGA
jgi:hypothetical protein